jgi:hypothetical protein
LLGGVTMYAWRPKPRSNGFGNGRPAGSGLRGYTLAVKASRIEPGMRPRSLTE